MYSKLKFIIVILLAMLMVPDEAYGQRRNKYQRQRLKSKKVGNYRGGKRLGGTGRFRPYHFVGAGINAFNYFGDLAPVSRTASTDITFTRPGGGLLYGYRFHPAMAARAGISAGYLRGDDFSADPNDENSAPRYARNLSFRNFIKELTLGIEFYVIPNYRGPSLRPPLNAYIFLGVTGFHHQPQGFVPDQDYQTIGGGPAPQAGEWVNLKPLGTEGQNIEGVGDGEDYSLWQIAVPLGIGGEIVLPGNLTLGLELGYRYVFTDYLDDVSTTYVGLDRFDDPLARILSDRGAEPIAAVSGESRGDINIVNGTFSDPAVTYNINGFVGSGTDGSKRGNPDDRDLYFTTQIRVTYILGARPRSTAKFR